jgi:Subtilase family
MPGERYRHIFLPGPTRTQGFTNPRRGGEGPRIPVRDRRAHSTRLQERLETVWRDVESTQAVAHTERHGIYIDFISEPGFDLMVKSLEAVRLGIRLLNVRRQQFGDEEQTLATVYVPHNQRSYFLKRIRAYAEQQTAGGRPKNAPLINSISDIRRSVLESFWQDALELIPSNDPQWIEVWLSNDQDSVVDRFGELLRQQNIEQAEGVLRFPERSVRVIYANRAQVEFLIEASDDIAEFRLAKEVASILIEMENRDQVERVQDLLARTQFDANGDVTVAILDSGINNGHILIQPVLANNDLHTVKAEWGTEDHGGHGTLMAGTVAYGDLLAALGSGGPVRVSHRLESAKILPPQGRNPERLWGYVTAQGISRAEIQAPDRRRVACLAVTATDFRDRGRPSSWAAQIDELSSGYSDNLRRLFIVSGGNVVGGEEFRRYPESNITNEIHDPGQSWNALTVGAYTEKIRIVDPNLAGYEPIAPEGGLSPYSTTSSTWSARTRPVKPDVVLEGGNVARGPNDSVFETDDLCLLSTYRDPQVAQFARFEATSAAAAQAAWIAAQIQVQYPEGWPETIRALIVHTAEWTETIKGQFLADESKGSYAKLLRVCGYGVPNLERSLYCAANSLTLISQAELQPYDRRDGRWVTRDMHLYILPWPTDVLRDQLGEVNVRMRVTVSYFIEPGPGEIGWNDRYRYPSHALRFAVNGPGESENEFIRRVNEQARDDGEHPGTEGPGQRWVIGEARNVGSIHSDIWQGQGAELAASNLVAVYPAVGWWRERHQLGRWNRRCRYSLLISILLPPVDVDIYTPVSVQVGVPVPIEISTS